MRNSLFIFWASLKQSPIVAALISGSFFQTFIETSFPVLQWLIAVAGLIFTVYQILIKHKEYKQLSRDISMYTQDTTTIE